MKLHRWEMETLGGGTDYCANEDDFGPWVRDDDVSELEETLRAVMLSLTAKDIAPGRRIDKALSHIHDFSNRSRKDG